MWKQNRRRFTDRTPTWDVLHKYPHDYKVVFVGDASMSPYEIMLNEDVENLFDRVKVGTRVVVLPGGNHSAPPATASAQPAPAQGYPDNTIAQAGGTTPTVVPALPAPVTVR